MRVFEVSQELATMLSEQTVLGKKLVVEKLNRIKEATLGGFIMVELQCGLQ